ncbi:zf-DHHC-domain-containing protein [Atractiella rhizophila]|nr:zf-DHHC-domain-containing protein [Atractiella rhizophila]
MNERTSKRPQHQICTLRPSLRPVACPRNPLKALCPPSPSLATPTSPGTGKRHSFHNSLSARQSAVLRPPSLVLDPPQPSTQIVIETASEKSPHPSVTSRGQGKDGLWPKRQVVDEDGRRLKVWEAVAAHKKVRSSLWGSIMLLVFPALEGEEDKGRPWSFILSFLLHIGLGAFWAAAVPSRLLDSTLIPHSAAIVLIAAFAYLYILSIAAMLRTSFADPGFLPANLDPEPEWEWVGGERAARMKTVRMDGLSVDTKWCGTCRSYRGVRSSHCKVCNVCTEGIDHHCTFLNNCVGRLNYGSFFVFLSSTVLGLLLSLAETLLILSSPPSWAHNIRSHPQILVLALLNLAVLTPILILYSYHIRLLVLGKSTIELIREGAAKRLSIAPQTPGLIPRSRSKAPFSQGSVRRNFLFALCRPATLDGWIEWEDWAEEDARRENPWFENEQAEESEAQHFDEREREKTPESHR